MRVLFVVRELKMEPLGIMYLAAPFSWYQWFFRVTKKYLSERDLWKAFG